MYFQYGFLYLILIRPKFAVQTQISTRNVPHPPVFPHLSYPELGCSSRHLTSRWIQHMTFMDACICDKQEATGATLKIFIFIFEAKQSNTDNFAVPFSTYRELNLFFVCPCAPENLGFCKLPVFEL